MQKEDLLKKIRLFATLATTAMVVLIVALVVQFGMIAYYNTEIPRHVAQNEANQSAIANMEKEMSYYDLETGKYKDDLRHLDEK